MEKIKIELVNVTEYSEKYGISRPTVYSLIEKNKITAYEVDGETKLNIHERPKGVKRYGERKNKIS